MGLENLSAAAVIIASVLGVPQAPPAVLVTESADCGGLDSEQPCRFTQATSEYQLGRDGYLERRDAAGQLATMRLVLEDGFLIERAEFLRVGDDLLLICEVHDVEVGVGVVARLDGASLRLKWRLHFPAFNISIGVAEGSSLYLAGIGTVAAIDLEQGRYRWKHEGLYDRARYSFNSFEVPEVGPTDVVFRERLTAPEAGRPRLVRVSKVMGRLSKE